MRYINWFLVSAGLFFASMIAFAVCTLVPASAWSACWYIGAGLNLTGWIAWFIGWFRR